MNMASVFQLRIYEVSSDRRAQFHERFERHALRIMRRYGFTPVALWESTSVSDFEFIYILQWPDIETMERQWKLFLADPEWIEIKRKMAAEIGEPVQRVTSRVLDDVGYSPALPPGPLSNPDSGDGDDG
jgi:heme-degrading monooxygenase HmoA